MEGKEYSVVAHRLPRPPHISCQKLFDNAVSFVTEAWKETRMCKATATIISSGHMLVFEISENMPSGMLYAMAAREKAEAVMIFSFASERTGNGEEVIAAFEDAAENGCLPELCKLPDYEQCTNGIVVAMRYADPNTPTIVRMLAIDDEYNLVEITPDVTQEVAMLPPFDWLTMPLDFVGKLVVGEPMSREAAYRRLKEMKVEHSRPAGSEKCLACDGKGKNKRQHVDEQGVVTKTDETTCACCGGRGWVRFQEA